MHGDPIDGAETMQLLWASHMDLKDLTRFRKIQEIIDYFKDNPNKKTDFYRLLIGKPTVDKVNHMWEYVGIKSQYDKVSNELSSIEQNYNKLKDDKGQFEKQLSYFER